MPSGDAASSPTGWPAIRNPIYSAIISHHVRLQEGAAILEEPDAIRDGLVDTPVTNDYVPDLTMAGRSNLLLPVIRNNETGTPTMPSPFIIQGQSTIIAQIVREIGYGAGTFVLLWALEWIRLGEMRWPDILNDCLSREPINPA